MDKDIKKITDKILTSKKYRSIYHKTVYRIVESISKKYPKKLWEIKSRNLLHQIWGLYQKKIKNQKYPKGTMSKIKDSEIQEILKSHTSSDERLPILNEFYTKIFNITGIPKSINDYACGLNPLTIPWMSLSEDTEYKAYDIDLDEINFLNSIASQYKLNFEAYPGDLLSDDLEYADVVFLLKTLPVLEQQEKGSSEKILKKLMCKFAVISFPLKSVGGQEKGMEKFYSTWFESIITKLELKFDKFIFSNELVYIVRI